MVGDASKSSTGLGKRKVFHKLPDARWHALRREKGIGTSAWFSNYDIMGMIT